MQDDNKKTLISTIQALFSPQAEQEPGCTTIAFPLFLCFYSNRLVLFSLNTDSKLYVLFHVPEVL